MSSPDAWNELWQRPQLAYCKSACFKSQPGPTAAWLRLGELDAQKVQCGPFEKTKFRAALDDVRKLTVQPPEQAAAIARTLCASAGVAVAFIREMKGCTASGVARWLTPDKALIQLSLRHRTDDQLWFTFFHEAGHILNDGKKEVFIDEDGSAIDEIERQADRFAANLLIPPNHAAKLKTLTNGAAVTAFAASMGIAPGIVVGRMQKEGMIADSKFNYLKRRLAWKVKIDVMRDLTGSGDVPGPTSRTGRFHSIPVGSRTGCCAVPIGWSSRFCRSCRLYGF